MRVRSFLQDIPKYACCPIAIVPERGYIGEGYEAPLPEAGRCVCILYSTLGTSCFGFVATIRW